MHLEQTVSVIIPVHNGGSQFRECLSALSKAHPPPKEVIVADDGSTDGSAFIAEEFGAEVLRVPTRSGPSRARNLGAHAAQGDILLFIDADVLVSADIINQVVCIFKQEHNLAAVIGSYDDSPGAPNFLSQYRNLFHHYIHQSASEDASTFWGACGAIRRDIFLAVGGFDENHLNMEDIELGYRLIDAGQRILLSKNMQVKHLKRWGIVNLLWADIFKRALPWTKLILRDRRLINDLNLKHDNRFSVFLTYCILITVLGSLWWSGSLLFSALMILFLIILNVPFYRFLLRKRGLLFTLQAIPWHWLYYLYSGLAFAFGIIHYIYHKLRTSNPPLPETSDQA